MVGAMIAWALWFAVSYTVVVTAYACILVYRTRDVYWSGEPGVSQSTGYVTLREWDEEDFCYYERQVAIGPGRYDLEMLVELFRPPLYIIVPGVGRLP
jgi:hypothetical protein